MSTASGDYDVNGLLLHKLFEEDNVTVKDLNSSASCDELITTIGDETEHITRTSENLSQNNGNDFDTIIGYIEDILIDDKFHELQLSFLEKYWELFVDSEENKHEYMEIFSEYTNEIEAFITKYIKNLMPSFEMEDFIIELERRKDNLDGEVFEVLFTLTDFIVFKEMFLDYRMAKEGSLTDLGQSLFISSIQ